MARRLYNFRIDEDLDDALHAIKDRDGISVSEQIRRAVREWASRRGVIKKSAHRRALTRRKA
jgi:hypothetical protein